jgi:hypothetical protein
MLSDVPLSPILWINDAPLSPILWSSDVPAWVLRGAPLLAPRDGFIP